MRRTLITVTLLAIIAAIALAIPLSAFAAEGDVIYTVQPGDWLRRIAWLFGVAPEAIIEANDISDPDLILVGQELIIPSPAQNPDLGNPAPASAVSSAPIVGSPGAADSGAGFTVEVGQPIYSGDGYVVDIPITVHNQSVFPAIAGGQFTSIIKPDGLYEHVALMSAVHGTFEEPYPGEALSWRFQVTLSDNATFQAIAGCRFIEDLYADGIEPIRADDGTVVEWYYWEVSAYGGWFDCGNAYRVNSPDIAPGASGSSVLTVYLVNPHTRALAGTILGTPYPGRTVTQLVGTFFKPDGSVAGTRILTVPQP